MTDMSVKANTKFPIAVVFYILSVFYSGLNILASFFQLYQSHNLRVALGGVFGSCLSLILPMVIILLLLLRKRNVLLFLALGMQAVFSIGSELFRARHMSMMEYNPLYYMQGPVYGLYKVIRILLCVTTLLFAADCLCSVEKPYNLFLKKIWFLPIAFYVLMGICTLFSGSLAWIAGSLIPGILGCAASATLCWWITRPYKNGYAPAQHPVQCLYFAPDTSYGSTVQTDWQDSQMQSAGRFCTQCGKPVVGGNVFCIYCGAPVKAAAPSEDMTGVRRGTAIPVGDSALKGKR